MAIASAFNLLPLNDQTHIPTFLNVNDGGEEELQFQLVLDAVFAEELQLEEVLKASLFTCQMKTRVSTAMASANVEVRGESPLSSCAICMERKENDQLISNGEYCGHSFCLDCVSKYLGAKINDGMASVTCPGLNCESVLKLCRFKHLIYEDVFKQWENYTEMIPYCSSIQKLDQIVLHSFAVCLYSKELHVKTSSESGNGNGEPLAASTASENPSPSDSEVKPEKFNHSGTGASSSAPVESTEIVPRRKQEVFLLQPRLSLRRENEGPKPVYSFSSNFSSPTTYSIPCKSRQDKLTEDVKKIVSASAVVIDDDTDFGSSSDTDQYDSEVSPRSSEICKKSKWFNKLVDELDCLSMEEIKDPARQWLCSACQASAGSVRRYLGVQALIQHAKTKGSTRVRLHRELAQLLEEKLLNNQANSAIPDGEACAKWIGLKEKNDQEIVWPPMVVITNAIHKKDDNNKWIGMTSQELLDLFSPYDAIVKVQHSYNWDGHCGTSILIFESSAKGYLEAERLHKHFEEQGTGRNAWNSQPIIFHPGGERQLYGYLAVKEDLDIFNRKSKSKPKLIYEMRSYQETVVNRIRQMSEDNNQLLWLKNRVAEQQKQAKNLEEFNNELKEKLQKATKEMGIIRSTANRQHQQSLEELRFQEEFYKDRITCILEARRQEKDEDLENESQEDD